MTRKLHKTVMIVLFAVGVTVNGFAQKSEISLELGAGNTTIDSNFEIVYPLKRYYDAFYLAGGKYTITTNNDRMNLYSGLSLDKKVLRNDHSEFYLKVPVGFHLNYGNRLKFHIGAGLNAGIHLGEPHSYKRVTLGTFINAGPSYRITENYRLMLSIQSNFDITPMALEHGSSQAGKAPGPDYHVRGYDGFLLLGVYRKIK